MWNAIDCILNNKQKRIKYKPSELNQSFCNVILSLTDKKVFKAAMEL